MVDHNCGLHRVSVGGQSERVCGALAPGSSGDQCDPCRFGGHVVILLFLWMKSLDGVRVPRGGSSADRRAVQHLDGWSVVEGIQQPFGVGELLQPQIAHDVDTVLGLLERA